EREHSAFNWTPGAKRRRRLLRVGLRKLLRAPRKNRAEQDFVGRAIDVHALRVADTFGRSLTELLFQRIRRERLAPQPAAAGRAAAQREKHPRIAEGRQHGLLNLVERQ